MLAGISLIVQVISEFGSDYDFIRFGVGYALTISDLNSQDEVSRDVGWQKGRHPRSIIHQFGSSLPHWEPRIRRIVDSALQTSNEGTAPSHRRHFTRATARIDTPLFYASLREYRTVHRSHFWYFLTSIEGVMHALHLLAMAGRCCISYVCSQSPVPNS